MTVHERESTRAKSKIILPQKPSTTLLQKKKKNSKSINKIKKLTTDFYKKTKCTTIKASLEIQNRSIIQYKVHSPLVDHLTRRRIEQVTS